MAFTSKHCLKTEVEILPTVQMDKMLYVNYTFIEINMR